MTVLTEIAGANATVQIVTPSKAARWVKFNAIGAGTVRVAGDNTASTTHGIPIVAAAAPGGREELPYCGPEHCYPMAGLWAYIPTGVTLTVSYEPFGGQ